MKVIIGVVIFIFTVVSGLQLIEQQNAKFYADLSGSFPTDNTTILETEEIKVSISGNIATPGTYTLESGCFLQDVIEAAGGESENTDYDAYNQYYVIEESMSFYIPKTSSIEKISLNNASEEDFLNLESIGTTLAKRIISYRNEIGYFEYLEQIMEVSGIGSSIFKKIRDNITLW